MFIESNDKNKKKMNNKTTIIDIKYGDLLKINHFYLTENI